ncbi:hypothetical protein P3W45_000032 [Vairimorpha bombi]|jgi:periodic tryptophan protein 1
MINTINYLNDKISIDKLKPYTKNQEILEELSYLEIPQIIEGDVQELEDNDTFICDTDLIVFSTSNSLDENYLQFHVYDQEIDDFVIHHDVFVFSSINDAEYLKLQDNHYVALATFEKNIMIYDSLVFNPLAPQILLKGHNEGVMCVKMIGDKLLSGSEDKTVIEWDLEVSKPRQVFDAGLKVEKMAGFLFCSESNKIKNINTGLEFNLDGTVENMVSIDNNLYLTTSTGHFISYDLRNMNSPAFSHKYSEVGITGLDVLKDKIGMCSESGEIIILEKSDFEVKNFEKIKSTLYSIKMHENNLIFYGDDTDNLNMRKLKNNIF